MNELQSDQAAALANLISREISLAAQTTELIGAVQLKAAKILSAWHGQLRPDSQAAAIYACFLHTLARRLLEPKLGVELTSEYMERWQAWPLIIERFLKHHGKEWLPPEERTYRGCLLTTFAESLKSLGLAFGADDPDRWPWGETHQAVFTHKLTELAPWAGRLLNPPPQMVGGDGYSVNTAEVEPGFNRGRFHARAGSTTRLLIDMGDSSKFYAGLSLGQSGQLFSPFARNQLRSWVEVAPYPVAFSAEEIERQTEHKLFLRNSK